MFRCPRCGTGACFACWQPSFERCQRCLLQYPAEAAPPIPWEQPGPALRRYIATLATAFRPVASAPALAGERVRPAARFALLSALPAALLAGIIPHTHTLMFQRLRVSLIDAPSALEVALDVVRAMAIEGVLSAIRFGCLFFPFVSLVRAYAEPQRRDAAHRVMLYRAWMLPGFWLVLYVLSVVLPAWPGSDALLLLLENVLTMAFLVLMLMSMSATARIACGLGPWITIAVVMVPVTLLVFVQHLAAVGLMQVFPPPTMPPQT